MTPLSRGARLCEQIIRCARARRGGTRQCGRGYLARRLDCSPRQVSRYVAELRGAGRLDVTPPPRVRTPRGWRTTSTNTYRLTRTAHPAPHVQTCRSGRGDTGVTPPLTGSGQPPVDPDPSGLIDPGPATLALLARLGYRT